MHTAGSSRPPTEPSRCCSPIPPSRSSRLSREPVRRALPSGKPGELRVGVIGAGAFVEANLLPQLGGLNARLHAVANRTASAFSRLQALYAPALLTTDPAELLADADVDAVLIGTRHDSHAALARAALTAGKAVHVEKPLALTLPDAEEVAAMVRGDRRPPDDRVQPAPRADDRGPPHGIVRRHRPTAISLPRQRPPHAAESLESGPVGRRRPAGRRGVPLHRPRLLPGGQ